MADPLGINSVVEVAGHSAMNKPALFWVRLGAGLFDWLWIVGLYGVFVVYLNFSPLPSWAHFFFFLVIVLALWSVQVFFFKATLGQWIWKIRKRSLRAKPIQSEHLSFSSLWTGIFLTALSLALSVWVIDLSLIKHPLFMTTPPETLKQSPLDFTGAELRTQKTEWIELAFFYTIGLWPKTFQGQPVLYQFPYEKGPPDRFPGHIVAQWDPPSIHLTLAGPLTSAHATPRDFLKKCLIHSPFQSYKCLKIREKILSKHFKEMHFIRSNWHSDWMKISWFEIENPISPSQEKTMGIHLSLEKERTAQDRYIFIFASGTEQTFILDRPLTLEGDKAKTIFEKSILTQRVLSSLSFGKTQANQQLSKINLESLEKLTQNANSFLLKMAEIQAILLSKISVEPKNFDAYFHLGGTALLFSRQGVYFKNPEWSAQARPLVAAALKYAEDLSPNDPRTHQLKEMFKKFSVSKK